MSLPSCTCRTRAAEKAWNVAEPKIIKCKQGGELITWLG